MVMKILFAKCYESNVRSLQRIILKSTTWLLLCWLRKFYEIIFGYHFEMRNWWFNFFINLSECGTNWDNRWFGTTRRRRRWKRDANFGTKSCKKTSRTRCCGRSRRYLIYLGISNVKFDFEAKIIVIVN